MDGAIDKGEAARQVIEAYKGDKSGKRSRPGSKKWRYNREVAGAASLRPI
jgi:hypothetical protein